ncbi:MAG: type IV toxin-antitoxin system AbiEi family antitoxin domain-containing protein [Candidatus Limnocylindrales bacterium]
MVRPSTLSRLSATAADQWGLVTRRQAEGAGVPRATFDRLTSDEGLMERVAHGVYLLTLAPSPDHVALRAAWLQLALAVPAWERTPHQGVVSHRSAAALYGIGELPADRHDFTLPTRKQSRRADVRIHQRQLDAGEWIWLRGLPVTRPARIASDLLLDNEDPEAVAQMTADAIRAVYDPPATIAQALAPHAARFGLRRGDGLALLRWLLDLVGDSDTSRWMTEARDTIHRIEREQPTPEPVTTSHR